MLTAINHNRLRQRSNASCFAETHYTVPERVQPKPATRRDEWRARPRVGSYQIREVTCMMQHGTAYINMVLVRPEAATSRERVKR